MSTDRDKEDSTCDECGRFLLEREIDDFYFVPMCLECVKSVRLLQLRQQLPANFDVKEVVTRDNDNDKVRHHEHEHQQQHQPRKPCGDCGKDEWRCGECYVYDTTLNDHPCWGDDCDKYCLDCAESRDWCPGIVVDGATGAKAKVVCGVHVPVIHVPPSVSSESTPTASKKQRTSTPDMTLLEEMEIMRALEEKAVTPEHAWECGA